MKTNLPTQTELATLAAAFSDIQDPSAKVDAALDVWLAAGNRLRSLGERAELISAMKQKDDAEFTGVMADITFAPGWVPLGDFLAKTLPRASTAERIRRFKDFLGVPNPAIPNGVESFADISTRGISEDCAMGFAHAFRRWLGRCVAVERAGVYQHKRDSMLLGRYGTRWAKHALGGEPSQLLEILIANTMKSGGRGGKRLQREKAVERVNLLISNGLLVKCKTGKKFCENNS